MAKHCLARLHNLDSLRGVAAFAVVLFHMAQMHLAPMVFPRGYLAVDLFFILSGIVIAQSYEPRLNGGMALLTFMKARAIRLYPLAIAGGVIGFGVLLMRHFAAPDKFGSLADILVAAPLNLLLLPTFKSVTSNQEVFPINAPLWSLSLEFIINAVWACALVRIRTVHVAALVVVSGLLYGAAIVQAGSGSTGWGVPNYLHGFPKVTFGFMVGVLIHRARSASPALPSIGPLALSALTIALLAMPRGSKLDMLTVFIVFPVLALLGTGTHQPRSELGTKLGELSYPIYAVHFPLLLLTAGLQHVKFPTTNAYVFGAVALAAATAAAWIALKAYDEPVRKALTARLMKAPSKGIAPRDGLTST